MALARPGIAAAMDSSSFKSVAAVACDLGAGTEPPAFGPLEDPKRKSCNRRWTTEEVQDTPKNCA